MGNNNSLYARLRKKVWITINSPENAPYKIDEARPPFLYINGEEFNLGEYLSTNMTLCEVGVDDRTFLANDSTMSLGVWHGDVNQGMSILLGSFIDAKEIKVDIFVIPRNIVSIKFDVENINNVLEEFFADF